MKTNELSKSKRKKLKPVIRILTIALCFGLAFSLVTVQTSEAFFGILAVVVGAFVAGAIIGWIAGKSHDSSSPDALVTSQENYVLVWNDFIEEWNNDYISENVNLHNYMMMYNLTFLDSVRRAEHDVASYVHLLEWDDVENNMSSLKDYKENITRFMVATLHGYNRMEVSILQHMYDTDGWAYTTPMKYAKYFHDGENLVFYKWFELEYYGLSGTLEYVQYKAPFGSYPVGYDGNYDIGDKFYVTFLYVPNGNSITLKDLETNSETVYSSGVHDLQGVRNEVINVTMYNYILNDANTYLDNTGVYLFGVPTDFNPMEDTTITYDTGFEPVGSRVKQSLIFETPKYIDSIYVSISSESKFRHVWLDGVEYTTLSGSSSWININRRVYNITVDTYLAECCLEQIKTEGYIYHDTSGGFKVVTESGGTAYVTDGIPDRGRIGLDWMVNSYKNIYDGMVVNARILWTLYHGNGWYSTDDIPSEFLVVAPDMIFDNMDALKNLPIDKAQAIYYAWMKQLIDFYAENPDYVGTYNDTDMTVFDDGIIINASLIHGGKTVFTNHQIYISPLLGDFYICKDNYYNLTQKVFIYDITANYIYYGYVGDNLTVYSITIDDVGTDCVTLGRQTMHDFLMGKYGFSISFSAEWVFPPPSKPNDIIYATIGVALICLGAPIWVLGGKKYNKIGIIMVLVGSGILIYIYILPIIIDFFDTLVFW